MMAGDDDYNDFFPESLAFPDDDDDDEDDDEDDEDDCLPKSRAWCFSL